MPCKTCQSWQPTLGECRHNPPSVVIDASGKPTRAFPLTGPDDWCTTGYASRMDVAAAMAMDQAADKLRKQPDLLPKDAFAFKGSTTVASSEIRPGPRRPPPVMPTKK